MYKIYVERDFNAPIEKVFAVLADHGAYDRFPGVTEAALIIPGKEDKNGLGAQRRIKAGPLTFVEDIIDYEEPKRFKYRIVESSPLKIDHEYGEIVLTTDGDKTHVVWTSKFRLPIPLVGGLLEKAVGPQFAKGFASMLKYVDQVLANS